MLARVKGQGNQGARLLTRPEADDVDAPFKKTSAIAIPTAIQ